MVIYYMKGTIFYKPMQLTKLLIMPMPGFIATTSFNKGHIITQLMINDDVVSRYMDKPCDVKLHNSSEQDREIYQPSG